MKFPMSFFYDRNRNDLSFRELASDTAVSRNDISKPLSEMATANLWNVYGLKNGVIGLIKSKHLFYKFLLSQVDVGSTYWWEVKL